MVEVCEDVPLVGEDGGEEASEDPEEAGGEDTTGQDDGAGDGGSRVHSALKWNEIRREELAPNMKNVKLWNKLMKGYLE